MRPAIIYAHGGGAVLNSAMTNIEQNYRMAVECNCSVFAVDYRKAPETKSPGGITDAYNVIRYVYLNAAEFGVDKSKICISGTSGGGYIILGAALMLVR
jgi:acetyl esterase